MNSDTPKNPQRSSAGGPPPTSAAQDKASEPDWANGLRQLYDEVVEEPLPDSFRNLLAQLDSKD
ncbi:NepR family anti-sigma factor [Qipengyuania sp.]|uniref:NepR family anti-sigma factor n=1 Tax=Qipengyuania sp. TaxID=2004515 RepID=UPI00351431E8